MFAVYLNQRPYGHVFTSIPVPDDVLKHYLIFSDGYDPLREDGVHERNLRIRYKLVRNKDRLEERQCLAFSGAERDALPAGAWSGVNMYVTGYYCAPVGAQLDAASISAVFDAVGIKDAGEPVPPPHAIPSGVTS